jgi:DsbC/DsbD-like thiol-disulfide interchange protein
MRRRTLIAGLGALSLARPAFAASDWQAKLVTGGFLGADFWAGLYVTLGDGWHTYWRVPGEAGIPPQIKVEGPDVTSCEVLYPLPQRIVDASGESIGYQSSVMFPLRISTHKTAGVEASVSAFFGVCQDICKPAKFEAMLSGAAADPAFIKAWLAKAPAAGSFVTGVSQKNDVLTVNLSQPVEDIFIEGPDGLYFRKPAISSGVAQVKIDGLTEGQKLKGSSLKFTAAMQGKGLEQVVAVA